METTEVSLKVKKKKTDKRNKSSELRAIEEDSLHSIIARNRPKTPTDSKLDLLKPNRSDLLKSDILSSGN